MQGCGTPRTPQGTLTLRIRGTGDSSGAQTPAQAGPGHKPPGRLWWPRDPAGTQIPPRRYLLDFQFLLIRAGCVLVVGAHHHGVGFPGHRQALSTGLRHGDSGFPGHPVPVPSPGPAGSRTGAYLTPQWAAVTTQFSLIRDPPQKWKPLLRCRGESCPQHPAPPAASSVPGPRTAPTPAPGPPRALTCRDTCHGQDPGTAASPLTMRV